MSRIIFPALFMILSACAAKRIVINTDKRKPLVVFGTSIERHLECESP